MKDKEQRIFLSPPHMGGAELAYVREAFESNYIAPVGPQLGAFERRFQEATGFFHCVGVSSGTAAMHLALRGVGVGAGDVVIASSLTFIGSVSPVTFLGAEPVFVDSEASSWNIDPDLVEQEIVHQQELGKRVGAVVPTDLYGQPCDYARLFELCERHGVALVSDCAESLGARFEGGGTGRGSAAAVFSFNGNKIITTSGGGMLATDDEELAAKARHWATQAREDFSHFEHNEIGYNYRMSNVVAAIGLGQLDVLADRVQRKREIFDWYSNGLRDLPGVAMMPFDIYGQGNAWLTVILLDSDSTGVRPEDVRLGMETDNIETRPMWKPMHQQPAFKGARIVGGSVSEDLFQRGLCLPSGTAMTEGDLERVLVSLQRELRSG